MSTTLLTSVRFKAYYLPGGNFGATWQNRGCNKRQCAGNAHRISAGKILMTQKTPDGNLTKTFSMEGAC